MRPLWLLARQRRAPVAALGLVVVVVAGALLGPTAVRIGSLQPITVPVVVLLPVAAACLIALTTVSTIPELERTADRPMTVLRLLLLLALLLPTTALLALVTAGSVGQLGPPATIRNLLGLTGLGLLGVAVLGGSFGWLPPCVLAGLAFIAGARGDGTAHPWAFVIRPNNDPIAFTTAVVLLLAGTIASLATQQRATTRATDYL